MSKHVFPIKDEQFHEEGLRNLDGDESDEATALRAWHVMAIGFIQYGQFKDFDGPAAEEQYLDADERPRFRPRAIKPTLTFVRDRFGQPTFQHEWED